MELFLQIIGGVVVTLVLFILGFYFFIKIKLGKLFNLDPDENQTPLRVHLNEDFVAPWMNKKDAVAANDEVINLGFIRGKSYSIPEMPSINLTAYFKQPVVAVIYHHDVLGVWLDFAAADNKTENEFTVSNGPLGSGADTRPEKQISWLKSYSVSQLHEAIHEKLDVNGDYLPINEDNFREYFEQSYRKDMKFRARNGGMSRAEFSRHVEEIGKKFSDKDLHQAFVTAKSQELEQWSEVAIEEFMESKTEQEQSTLYEDSSYLFIVPFSSHSSAFISYLEEFGFVDADDEEELAEKFAEETDMFALFDILNNGRSPELRAVQVGESDYPLALKIYKHKYS